MKVALVGQPNSGKSTVFNAVAGYRTVTANFPGTTIESHQSRVSYNGERFDLMEFPGIYSLTSPQPDEQHARRRLLAFGPDVVVNIIDASVLCRSLEFTLELLELGMPLVVGLNMMDEAQRKGVSVDIARLTELLGVPVIPLVATRGEGIPSLFRAALDTAASHRPPPAFSYSRDVEAVVTAMKDEVAKAAYTFDNLPPRLLAQRLLEGEASVEKHTSQYAPALVASAQRLRSGLEESHGRPSDVVLSSERHALCLNLFENVAEVKPFHAPHMRERLDQLLMHPFWGYVALVGIFVGFFYFIFGTGQFVEKILLTGFSQFDTWLMSSVSPGSLSGALLTGLTHGFTGGVGIVLPYLVPFFLGLAFLEDSGYIPRVAFLMDNLMHRIGLHGKAIIPLVLGYGCTVPAIMGTRILDDRRDRYLTALLVNFIPCAARTTIVFAVVGARLGAGYALSLYGLNLVIIAVVGKIAARFGREESLGMILEMPSYKVPKLKPLIRKTWFRLREFILIAWPILVIGSIALGTLTHFHLIQPFNRILEPFTTGVLGLPAATSWPLLMGILRKELSVIMLVQSLGTSDLSAVLTSSQMLVFTVFSLFYIPCLATLATLRVVMGMRGMLVVSLLSLALAIGLAIVFRFAFFFLDSVQAGLWF